MDSKQDIYEEIESHIEDETTEADQDAINVIESNSYDLDYQEDGEGWTILYTACVYSRVAVIKALLDKGANPNLKTKRGSTPLGYSAFKGDTAVCELLIKNGADVNSVENNSQTPLDQAVALGKRDTGLLLNRHGGKC